MKFSNALARATTSIAPLYLKLTKERYDVLVAHPKKTRYIAKARIKTDRVNSMALARAIKVVLTTHI